MNLYDLNWPEIEAYLKNKKSIIIPAGTCEQHGMHLPLNTDTIVTEYIARFLSEKTGIIVAPTLNYGINLPCDRFYSGTCSLTQEILENLVKSVIAWWKEQGFMRFYILSAHGDLFHIRALQGADREYIKLLELYELSLEDILEKQKGIKHACEGETSVMMYLYPETVRKEFIKDFVLPWDIMKDYFEHKRCDRIEDCPGSHGYPSFATKEKGHIIIERMKERALKWILEEEKTY